jgi:hypothetical protein
MDNHMEGYLTRKNIVAVACVDLGQSYQHFWLISLFLYMQEDTFLGQINMLLLGHPKRGHPCYSLGKIQILIGNPYS